LARGGLRPPGSGRRTSSARPIARSFERNLGGGSALKLQRGPNALWSRGGLMYAIPLR
jgi:general L-amino acid transport system substrate-binding protein